MFVIMASLDGMDYYVAYANDQYCLVPVADYDSSKHALTVNSNKSIAIKMTKILWSEIRSIAPNHQMFVRKKTCATT